MPCRPMVPSSDCVCDNDDDDQDDDDRDDDDNKGDHGDDSS